MQPSFKNDIVIFIKNIKLIQFLLYIFSCKQLIKLFW